MEIEYLTNSSVGILLPVTAQLAVDHNSDVYIKVTYAPVQGGAKEHTIHVENKRCVD